MTNNKAAIEALDAMYKRPKDTDGMYVWNNEYETIRHALIPPP